MKLLSIALIGSCALSLRLDQAEVEQYAVSQVGTTSRCTLPRTRPRRRQVTSSNGTLLRIPAWTSSRSEVRALLDRLMGEEG